MFKDLERTIREKNETAKREAAKVIDSMLEYFNDPEEGEARFIRQVRQLEREYRERVLNNHHDFERGNTEVVLIDAKRFFPNSGMSIMTKKGEQLCVARYAEKDHLVFFSFVLFKPDDAIVPHYSPPVTYAYAHSPDGLEDGRQRARDMRGVAGSTKILLNMYQASNDVPFIFLLMRLASIQDVVDIAGPKDVLAMGRSLEQGIRTQALM